MINLYEIQKRNGNDAVTGLIEDVTIYSPEFFQIPAIARAGIDYSTLTRTALPVASFRGMNQALTGTSSTYKKQLHQMYFLDVPLFVDEMAYKADDGITGDLLYTEAQGGLQAFVNKVGAQTWYGAANDGSQGFVGARAQLLSQAQTNPTATPVTASNSPTSSTVYGLWLGTQGCNYAVGKLGDISYPSWQNQALTFPVTTNTGQQVPSGYRVYYTNISSFIGFSVGSAESVFGVTGVTPIGGASPMTDALGAQLISTVPLPRRSGFVFFMNRGVHAGLQKSRTAITYQPAGADSGTPAWPSPPLSIEGFPIVLTDNISNTENNS